MGSDLLFSVVNPVEIHLVITRFDTPQPTAIYGQAATQRQLLPSVEKDRIPIEEAEPMAVGTARRILIGNQSHHDILAVDSLLPISQIEAQGLSHRYRTDIRMAAQTFVQFVENATPQMAGIRIFATGGIGGVHRGAETTMDISADLEELAQTPVMVVCAGAKSILDPGLTLEYLETKGVPVIGYGTKELPAFYTRKSGFAVDYEIDTPEDLAKAFHVARQLDMKGGMLVTNPIPEEYSMDHKVIDAAIEQALADAKAQGIHGKETTPFLLARVKDLTGGDSLDSNIQLVYNNARLAAKTACALQTLEQA